MTIRYSRGLTIVLTVILVLLVIAALRSPRPEGLSRLDRPVVTTIVLHEQQLTMSIEGIDGWWAKLRRFVVGVPHRPLDAAAVAYGSLLSVDSLVGDDAVSVGLYARQAVALATLGRTAEAQRSIGAASAVSETGAVVSEVIAFTHLGLGEEPARSAFETAIRAFALDGIDGESWTAAQVKIRFFERTGQPAFAAAVRSDLHQRAYRLAGRASLLTVIHVIPTILGLLFLALVFLYKIDVFRPGNAAIPAPWSLATGYAMVLRAVLLAGLAAVVLGFAASAWPGAAGRALSPVWTALVIFIYVGAVVLHRRGLEPKRIFGLWPGPPLGALVAYTLVLVAVGNALEGTLEVVRGHLGLTSPWTELVDEELLIGSRAEVWATVVSVVIGAPLGEELLFRGLIYGTLRTRIGPLSSALVSAAMFAFAHTYSILDSAVVFAGGIVSAVIYEKSRSLLPCILEHAVHNAEATGATLFLSPFV